MIRPIECPICGKPVPLVAAGQASHSPFCSERCRQIDLLRWCKGKYAIVEPLSPEDLARTLAEGDELSDELES